MVVAQREFTGAAAHVDQVVVTGFFEQLGDAVEALVVQADGLFQLLFGLVGFQGDGFGVLGSFLKTGQSVAGEAGAEFQVALHDGVLQGMLGQPAFALAQQLFQFILVDVSTGSRI